jgi:hypothetical protein
VWLLWSRNGEFWPELWADFASKTKRKLSSKMEQPVAAVVTLDVVLQLLSLNGEQVLNVYQTGSRVYGCFEESSDW